MGLVIAGSLLGGAVILVAGIMAGFSVGFNQGFAQGVRAAGQVARDGLAKIEKESAESPAERVARISALPKPVLDGRRK